MSAPRKGSNTALDFLLFVMDLLERNVLVHGDILIVHNSRIHYSKLIAPLLDALFDSRGVRLYFLPVYSAELNPCELVFGQVKRYLRDQRGNDPFLHEVLYGFIGVSAENVQNFYHACLSLNVS